VSNGAIDWAIGLQLDKSSVKFVLVCLANRANDNTALCFPSIKQLEQDTCQDRKTVISNLRALCQLGLIQDTGERVGTTKQIIVYRLMVGSSPKIGTSTENGTVPVLESNSTVFPHEQSRFSVETVPKTVHGTQRNPKGTQARNARGRRSRAGEKSHRSSPLCVCCTRPDPVTRDGRKR
jgi:pyocin large subunit-like protein